MHNEELFSNSQSWFTAEGIESEKPVMYRGRSIPEHLIGASSLPNIFVITFHFDASDETGLPTSDQYQLIDDFEEQVTSLVEGKEQGIIAFIKTFNGVVRYFLYVANVDFVSNALATVREDDGHVDFASGNDSDWTEYRAFLRGMHS